MDVRNNLDALRTLIGVSTPIDQKRSTGSGEASSLELGGDKATLSAGAAAMSQSVDSSDVRMEKVVAVQAAIASGSYAVPASAVADKMVNAMLSEGSFTEPKNR